MRLVTAVVRPHRWEAVRSALEMAGVSGITVSEAHGCGRRTGRAQVDCGAEHEVATVRRIRVEVVVEDALVEPVLSALVRAARTGRTGDGTVWVVPVEDVVRVRTGDRAVVAP